MNGLWIRYLVLDLGGLISGGALLFAIGPMRRIRVGRELLWWLGFGGFLFVAAALLARSLSPSVFPMLRLWCHALFCVLAPLALLRGLFRVFTGRARWFGIALSIAALVLEGAYLWMRHVEPYRLQVREHRIESERLAGSRRIRVVVLADLQAERVTAYERRVFAQIEALHPDLLLIPGDLTQVGDRAGHRRVRAELAALFSALTPPRLGIYMVDGDMDPPGLGVPGSRVVLLRDELRRVAPRLQILGLSPQSARGPFDVDDLAPAIGFDGLTIVLGHSPDFAELFLKTGISTELVAVAGHTHGGQVVVPLIGPILTLSKLPRRFAAGGLFRIGDVWLLVSRGVGLERGFAPRIRLFCPPELVVLDLLPRSGVAQRGSLEGRR